MSSPLVIALGVSRMVLLESRSLAMPLRGIASDLLSVPHSAAVRSPQVCAWHDLQSGVINNLPRSSDHNGCWAGASGLAWRACASEASAVTRTARLRSRQRSRLSNRAAPDDVRSSAARSRRAHHGLRRPSAHPLATLCVWRRCVEAICLLSGCAARSCLQHEITARTAVAKCSRSRRKINDVLHSS